MGAFIVNGKVALANNDYKTCERIYGSAFTYWFTHYFSMGNLDRK